ncbi:alpha beta-hydrolase [Coniophora puteana RWD-64-598 SS2]|uniref:Alpha beta-hydrolase n=1 Tax=Coniophora puteana (strain RWD-64-598) TaxID=741705 RepID=A0A5M3MI21_CONPW|nr:alpha beta-hydrolase [Coniophora puteana RWD-64-598 SS2]EIW78656.1 alpha beta-hydrolase [Coniophora puteana RWD-64-598 SS2]
MQTIHERPGLPGLHPQVRSRLVDLRFDSPEPTDRLRVHILEAFPDGTPSSEYPTRYPLILLLHGFPELAYSWRKVLQPLANEGYHVVAPDQRFYGKSVSEMTDKVTGQVTLKTDRISYQDSLRPFHILNMVDDVTALVKKLGHSSVHTVVGHDFGSMLAGYCVLAKPSLFRSVIFVSMPFMGANPPGGGSHQRATADPTQPRSLASVTQSIQPLLARLPEPRTHYSAYFSTPTANHDLLALGPRLPEFLKGYYYIKSASWPMNKPYRLACADHPHASTQALVDDLAKLPHYYVMPVHATMPDVVRQSAGVVPDLRWLTAEELAVYACEFERTGFQGGLNGYRSALCPPPFELESRLQAYAKGSIEMPAAFIGGAKDWGVFQTPGADSRSKELCTYGPDGRLPEENFVLIEGAGHWVQQEQPEDFVSTVKRFLQGWNLVSSPSHALKTNNFFMSNALCSNLRPTTWT